MQTPIWKLIIYMFVLGIGVVTALPNLFTAQQLDSLPSWIPKKQVTLGLDLRGGSHLVLEVDSETLINEKIQSTASDVKKLLRDENIVANVRVDKRIIIVNVIDEANIQATLDNLNKFILPAGKFGNIQSEFLITQNKNLEINLELTEIGVKERIKAALEQSLEVVRRRIDQVGVSEPTVQRVGNDRILVQLPGLQDPTHLRKLLGSTAKMNFHLLAQDGSGGLSEESVINLPDANGTRKYLVGRQVMLSGDRLSDAHVTFDNQTGQPVVSFRFDNVGGKLFGEITKKNVGRALAIVMDRKVLSAPIIQEAILGGNGQISGNFTVQEATMLSALLRAGALPAPLTVIEERTVGPDLGGDAIKMGVYTGLFGFALVFLFMVFLYGKWGVVANIALLMNVILTFSVLSLLGATLTLPGIAGIILGIGLAVDANVLINERIREETRKGMGAMGALHAGFDRAYSTIVDSNVTTLISTLLLFQFGSGPVKGFAVTMGLGILISMFTAVAVVRVIMIYIVARSKIKKLHIEPPIRLFPDGTSIRFMRGRFIGIGLSLALSLASIALFIKPGLNYGVDFKGGIQMEVKTSEVADLAKLRSSLQSLNIGEVVLQEFGNQKNVLIKVERQQGGEQAQNDAVATIKSAVIKAEPTASYERVEVVGSKISGELVKEGILSVVLAGIAMLIYIWIRFEWHFAVGAIVTLILDITKTIGFFAIVGLDFNLTAIAALLTLIGYSVNDKVVVYDRMRENMRAYKKMPLRDLIDKSINETLGRSLYTSVTAFLAILPMAIAGGSAVESFAIPMLFGIVIAASSSIFIAAPILLFLGDWREKRKMQFITAEQDLNDNIKNNRI
jgi:SecD/SecF fusion protein